MRTGNDVKFCPSCKKVHIWKGMSRCYYCDKEAARRESLIKSWGGDENFDIDRLLRLSKEGDCPFPVGCGDLLHMRDHLGETQEACRRHKLKIKELRSKLNEDS